MQYEYNTSFNLFQLVVNPEKIHLLSGDSFFLKLDGTLICNKGTVLLNDLNQPDSCEQD